MTIKIEIPNHNYLFHHSSLRLSIAYVDDDYLAPISAAITSVQDIRSTNYWVRCYESQQSLIHFDRCEKIPSKTKESRIRFYIC